jgi:NAD(P)-dependent dehydrogenase (short-subunit alcohol dehydrogenase family)
MKELVGRVAVITGAAGGIGRGIAESLAAAGMRLVLADIDARKLEVTCREIANGGAEVVAVATDVTSEASVDALADRAVARFGSVSVLCNNAGIWDLGAAWEISVAEWRRMIDINLWGVIYGIRAFVPLLLKNADGGHVVNTSSMAGLIGTHFRAPYAATKHAVVGLSQSLREEAKTLGLKLGVTVVCPGRVDTKVFGGFAGIKSASSPQLKEKMERAAAILDAAPAIPPRIAGDMIRSAIQNDEFYVLPNATARHRPSIEAEYGSMIDAYARGEESAIYQLQKSQSSDRYG